MREMTSLERVQRVLDGGIPDRVPVGLHNYLQACRMAGASLRRALVDGEVLAEAQLLAWREFRHDLIMSENGVTAEAQAMGCAIAFQDGIPPHVEVPRIQRLEDIDRLEVPDPETAFPLNELLVTTRILVRETGGKVFIQGRADQGPMALAMALCGPERFLYMAMDPEARPRIRRLLDLCTRMNIALGEAQRRAGAHGSTIGAVGTSLISPALYRELEFPGNKAFCDALRRSGCRAFVHVCGKEDHLLEDLVATGADCLELDPGTDPDLCKRAVQGRTCVLGMLDPARILGHGSPGEVRDHVTRILEIMAPGGGFILGPGCCLPPETPPENIHALMECTRTAGRYDPDGGLRAGSRRRILETEKEI